MNLVTKGDYNMTVKKYAEAIKSYENCVKVFNQNGYYKNVEVKSKVYENLGKAYFLCGDYGKSEESYSGVISTMSVIKDKMQEALAKQQQDLKDFNLLISKMHVKRAQTKYKQNKQKSMLEDLRTAHNISPNEQIKN